MRKSLKISKILIFPFVYYREIKSNNDFAKYYRNKRSQNHYARILDAFISVNSRMLAYLLKVSIATLSTKICVSIYIFASRLVCCFKWGTIFFSLTRRRLRSLRPREKVVRMVTAYLIAQLCTISARTWLSKLRE